VFFPSRCHYLIVKIIVRFRWVALQVTELRGCVNKSTLKAQLRSLPKGLNESYDRLLLKVPERHRNHVKRILGWIAFSARPITVLEAAEIAVFSFTSENEPICDITDRFRRPEEVIALLSSFVVVSNGMCAPCVLIVYT